MSKPKRKKPPAKDRFVKKAERWHQDMCLKAEPSDEDDPPSSCWCCCERCNTDWGDLRPNPFFEAARRAMARGE